jgi:drug/metabolite transporter (DMT)-like permease
LQAPLVALSILGETIGASILAGAVFGEALSGYQVLGGGMILGGIDLSATAVSSA